MRPWEQSLVASLSRSDPLALMGRKEITPSISHQRPWGWRSDWPITPHHEPGQRTFRPRLFSFSRSWISSPGALSAWLPLDHSPLWALHAHTQQHSARSHQAFPHRSTSCNGGFSTAHSQPSQLSRQIKQRPGPQIKHLFMQKGERSRWEGEGGKKINNG